MKEETKNMIQEADAALHIASVERMRPEEDVVAYSICHNSRLSIRMYLASYLLKHGVTADANPSITELLTRCAAINPDFSKVDVSEIECRGAKAQESNEYCLAVGQVSNCFEAANEVRRLIYSIP
ncbi:MAG: hypothetical protein ABI565_04600 [Vicinamibacteria bacterium]